VTFMPANGCFIDVASGGGLTMRALIWIQNADPSTIVGYANMIKRVMQTLESLRADLAQGPNKQLPEAWPTGAASRAARERLGWLVSDGCFGTINKGAGDFAGELSGAAAQLQKAQQIYNAVVSAMNGVVGALMSNPFTQGAAVSLAQSVVNIVSSFLKIVGRILDALHVAKLVKLVHDIMQIVDAVKKVIDAFNGGGSVTTPPTFPGTQPTLPGTPGTPGTPTFPGTPGYPGTPPTFPNPGGPPVVTLPYPSDPSGTVRYPGSPTTGNGNGSATTPPFPNTNVGLPPGYNGGTGGYNGSPSIPPLPNTNVGLPPGFNGGTGGFDPTGGYNNGGGSTSPGWVPVNPTDPGTTTGGGGSTNGGGTTTGGGSTNSGGTTNTGGTNGNGDTITIQVSKDGVKVLTPGDLQHDVNIHVDATVDGERVSGDVNIDV
jgi:hypothetical protein